MDQKTDLNFTQWLRKYFHDGEMRIVYKSKYDGKEYDLDDLERRYMKSRGFTEKPGDVDRRLIAQYRAEKSKKL